MDYLFCSDCNDEFLNVACTTVTSYCHGCCSIRLADKEDQLEKLQSDLETFQARLQFLRCQTNLHNELGDGILESDVRILVNGRKDEELFAHKFVLSSRSPVFCKMFDTKMLEEETGRVLIDDASHDVVKAVIKFCYDAEIDFTDGVTAEEVLAVAHKYDIGLLQTICEKEMITTLSCENLAKMLRIARKFMLTDLERAASRFFKRNFNKTIASVLAEIF